MKKLVYASVAPHESAATCHNDLHPDNLIFLENEVKAIDFDGLRQGDPYFDIATIAAFYCVSPESEQIMLSTYLGRKPSAIEKARLYLTKQVVFIVFSLSILNRVTWDKAKYKALEVKSFFEEIAEGLSDPYSSKVELRLRAVKAMLNEVLSIFKSQKFKDALAQLL